MVALRFLPMRALAVTPVAHLREALMSRQLPCFVRSFRHPLSGPASAWISPEDSTMAGWSEAVTVPGLPQIRAGFPHPAPQEHGFAARR